MPNNRAREESATFDGVLEFLDDEDEYEPPAAPARFVPLPPPVPVQPANPWTAMDADYRVLPALL